MINIKLNTNYKFISLSVFLTLIGSIAAYAQNNFANSFTNKDKLTAGLLGIHTTLNEIHKYQLKIEPYRTKGNWILDQNVPNKLNRPIAHISDGTAITACVLFGYSFLNQLKQENYAVNKRMVSNLWLCYNITETIKNSSKFARPYTQTMGVNQKKDIRSFISGHSALTACMATNLWLYEKERKWIPITASVLSISTASLRIGAGKHYTSDILAGMAVGIGVAIINQQIKKI